MPQKETEIKFALEFPQGNMLFMKNNGIYFLPHQSAEAFQVYGERKELFGKNAVNVSKSATNPVAYNLVYEFAENGAMQDARIVTQTETSRGALLDGKTVQALSAALAAGQITMYDTSDTQPPSVYNAARLNDGRILIQMSGKNELYLGTPGGQYEKLDAHLYVQGGCSMYYKFPDGATVELPWGFGGPNHETPKFKGEAMAYVTQRSGEDPMKYGLDLSGGVAHISPFTPGLPQKPATQPAAPKAPGM